MTPRDFCRQSLEVLALPTPEGDPDERGVYETLLRYFAADDLPADTFELQLHLLADPELCPHMSVAATRTLHEWQRTRQHTDRELLAVGRN